MKRKLLIGAYNVDLQGFSEEPFTLKDCNGGRITITAGGVIRNIATTMSYLREEVSVITAMGEDAFKDILLKDLREAGIEDVFILKREMETSSYLNLVDEKGCFVAGLSDMRCIQSITYEEVIEPIMKADLIVLDGCLHPELIKKLTLLDKVIYFDPVSMGKAKVLLESDACFYGLKLNLLEAKSLLGRDLVEEKDFHELYEVFSKKGLHELIVTREEQSVFYRDDKESFFTPVKKIPLVNPSGSGDTFLGAYLSYKNRGYTSKDAISRAIDAAGLSCQAEEPVSTKLKEQGGHHG